MPSKARNLGQYRFVRLRWRMLFAVVDGVGAAVFAMARALRWLVLGHGGSSTSPLPEPKRILLVQLDHLGDAIITTAMLGPLRQRFPQAAIEVLAGQWNREVFEAALEIDRVDVCRVNRFARSGWGRCAWIPAAAWWGLRLRWRRIDLAIDVRGDFSMAMILWLCGAKQRLGWTCGGGGFLLTHGPRFVADRPEVQSRLALLAELGIWPAEDAPLCPVFRTAPSARRRVSEWLREMGESREGREAEQTPVPRLCQLVVLHMGAGTPAKQWPAEHWRELLGRILAHSEVQVVLVGGAKDSIIARRILGERVWPGVVDWTGRLSLAELAALMEGADVVVGADSGPAHLAAAVGTPVVVLFSGTNNPRQWQPCGRQVTVLRQPVGCRPCHRQQCPWPHHPCMTTIRPEQVAAEVSRILVAFQRSE